MDRRALKDTKSAMFGALLVELPSNYTGGQIEAFARSPETEKTSDERVNWESDFRRKERENEFSLFVTVVSAQLDYSVAELESGHRLIAEYALDWCFDANMTNVTASKSKQQPKSTEDALVQCLPFFANDKCSLAIMLNEDYEGEVVERFGFLALKGSPLASPALPKQNLI